MIPDWIDTDSFLFTMFWQTSFWLAAGLVASALLRRHPARSHGVLLMCIAAALITPVLSFAFDQFGWGLFQARSLIGAHDTPPSDLPPARALGDGVWFTTSTILVIIWCGLAAFMALRLGVSIVRGLRLLARAERIDHPALNQAAQNAAKRLGLADEPEVLACTGVNCPVIWCWGWRPRILLPLSMLDGRGPDLTAVLCHELAHWKRRDHVWSLAVEIVTGLLAWHPLMWPARRRVEVLSEQACDAWVLATGATPTNYADTLLALLPQRTRMMALPAVHSRSTLSRRIVRILDDAPSPPASGVRFTVLAAMLLLGLTATTSLAQRRALSQTGRSSLPNMNELVTPAIGDAVASDERRPFLIEVVPAELDLGFAVADEVKSGSVWLINRGPRPVRITGAKASCGCTTVQDIENTILAPGTSMQVAINMVASGAPGSRKTKHVTFHFEGYPPLKIPVHATIRDTAP